MQMVFNQIGNVRIT